ncbi:MAG: NAD+ synthase [Candidatus Krumholzibacteria bacterium]|nr:NAD+ synthase [Candidatus Krumholzibacteria bacterium]MDP6668755.1 NAD+ synthase [Candidatus Krumholzibacteria bacterium]MDP6797506.1 NAD+ synthase [Candidatus Krumholzibacteria bacterium]MDP7021501.1 NAD+ synthase [Candidatus Krumholzibacteria bacterium]
MRTPFADIDYELVHRILIRFLQSEIGRTGLERGILGLSGGLDSALVAYLAVEALGVDRVTAVSMPYRSSSEESRSHARLVASATGLELLEVDISPMVDSYYKNEPDASTLRRGNKMARERMSILYDLSAEKGALVLGTSNKSELFLGYGTAFGDLASAVNPIGDLYKSEVRQLSRLLGVPTEIVDKPPSADLFAGQSDEEDLGFSYDEVDPLLRLMLDERRNTEECVEEGFDRALVERVTEMIRRSQFKRRLPVVAKISRRTVDRDFRYPRDWGTG